MISRRGALRWVWLGMDIQPRDVDIGLIARYLFNAS